MHTLVIPLVGPMQSWGYRSRFDIRDTSSEPTRSGVIGLICAALGLQRDADLSPFDPLRMGVRVDHEGAPRIDYHTALAVVKASGSGCDTVVSWRHYLSDARFIVGLEGNDEHLPLLHRIDAALRKPVYPLFLGRKAFVPSLPPYLPGTSVLENHSLDDAFRSVPWCRLKPKENISQDGVRYAVETQERQGPDIHVMGDRPLSFEHRRFGLRAVQMKMLSVDQIPDNGGHWPCIFLD
jgi:CRISPR system Cascade subunit CasD